MSLLDQNRTWEWRALKKQVMARDGAACAWCDSTDRLELDHIVERARFDPDDPEVDHPENLRLLCRRCHATRKPPPPRSGKRAAGRSRVGTAPPMGALAAPRSPAGAKFPQPPGAPQVPQGVQGEGVQVPAKPARRRGLVQPRIESKRRRRVSHWGDEVAEVARTRLGFELTPWQQYAAARVTEHDRDGQLVWPFVVVTIARGQGKSWWLAAMQAWRLLQAERFGEPQEVVGVAQKLELARAAWTRITLGLEETGQVEKVRRAAGQEVTQLPDKSTLRVLAATLAGTTGYRASMIAVDEAWKVPREVVEAGLIPQTQRRNQPQVFLVSTAGDGSSDLLTQFRDRALAPGNDNTLLLEWSAPPEAPPQHPHTWMWANPDSQWDKTTRRRFGQLYESTPEGSFRTQYLNQWVDSVDGWLPPAQWQACEAARPVDLSGGHVAIDCDPTGQVWAAVWAAPDETGRLHLSHVRSDKPGPVWQWVAGRPEAQVHIGASVYGLQPDGLLDQPVRFGVREIRRWLPGVRQLIGDRLVCHTGDTTFTEQVLRSQVVTTQTGQLFRLSTHPQELARLMVVAVGAAQRNKGTVFVV